MYTEKEKQVIQTEKDIIVLYHKHCVDGFAGAWVAHKKFGDTAEYVPVGRGETMPVGLEGKDVYVIDFCFSKEEIEKTQFQTKKFVIIDHHISSKEDVESAKEFVFDLNYSGSYLAYRYFFPNEEVPLLLRYISDGDRNTLGTLPNDTELLSVVYATPLEFAEFDKLESQFVDDAEKQRMIGVSKVISTYREKILSMVRNSVHFVELEGVVMPAVNACLPIDEKSIVLSQIYDIYPPVALYYRFDNGTWNCSLRSNGDFDCTTIATKFGGGGHKGAAGFAIQGGIGLPFVKMLSEEEIPESFKAILAKDKEK